MLITYASVMSSMWEKKWKFRYRVVLLQAKAVMLMIIPSFDRERGFHPTLGFHFWLWLEMMKLLIFEKYVFHFGGFLSWSSWWREGWWGSHLDLRHGYHQFPGHFILGRRPIRWCPILFRARRDYSLLGISLTIWCPRFLMLFQLQFCSWMKKWMLSCLVPCSRRKCCPSI